MADIDPSRGADATRNRQRYAAERRARNEARRRRARSRAALVTLGALLALGIVAVFYARFVLAAKQPTQAAASSAVATGAASAAASAAAAASTPSAPATAPAAAPASAAPAPSTASSADSGLPAAAIAAEVPYPGAPAVKPVVIAETYPKKKLVAITLDDGIPIDTRLLDLFEKRHVRVTTFLLGQAVKQYPKLVKRMHRDGIEIGVHGWDHKSFSHMTPDEMRSQLNRTQKLITKITGSQAPYFRPPYGAFNHTVVHVAAEEGYKTVLWDGTFVDTAPKAWPEYSYKKAMLNLHPGAIILCHWGHPNATYGAMVLLLNELDRRGYQVVTISELLAQSPPVKPYKH